MLANCDRACGEDWSTGSTSFGLVGEIGTAHERDRAEVFRVLSEIGPASVPTPRSAFSCAS